ncbi:MAG: hypothetical protein WB646_09310 [Steroidobacteraceae bacterium]
MSVRLSFGVLVVLSAGACARHANTPAAATAGTAARHDASACLPDDSGYLRLRVRGAQNFDLDWRAPQLQCEGGPRPDQNGMRLTFAAPSADGEHRPRLVLGVAATLRAGSSREVPANVTLILEGENRIYSTRGDDKCMIDELLQTPIDAHTYRIAGRGFCSGPASSLDGTGNVLVSRFDFAGRAVDAAVADHPQ